MKTIYTCKLHSELSIPTTFQLIHSGQDASLETELVGLSGYSDAYLDEISEQLAFSELHEGTCLFFYFFESQRMILVEAIS